MRLIQQHELIKDIHHKNEVVLHEKQYSDLQP